MPNSCNICGRVFAGGEGYVILNDKPTCMSCHDAQAPKCAICNKIFEPGQAISILGSKGLQYHPECVKCCDCDKMISGAFKILQEDPLLIIKCSDCCAMMHVCHICKMPIRQERYQVDDQKRPVCKDCVPSCVVCLGALTRHCAFNIPGFGNVHAHCFKCSLCKEPLVDAEDKPQYVTLKSNGKPGCFECNNKELEIKVGEKKAAIREGQFGEETNKVLGSKNDSASSLKMDKLNIKSSNSVHSSDAPIKYDKSQRPSERGPDQVKAAAAAQNKAAAEDAAITQKAIKKSAVANKWAKFKK